MKNGEPFVFAGLRKALETSRERGMLHSCTIITGEPNGLVREIKTRKPVILPDEHIDAWLSGESGKEILVPFPPEKMKAWAISPRVNSPRTMMNRFWTANRQSMCH
jgi:putative SOS response-associated peptidase YedK